MIQMKKGLSNFNDAISQCPDVYLLAGLCPSWRLGVSFCFIDSALREIPPIGERSCFCSQMPVKSTVSVRSSSSLVDTRPNTFAFCAFVLFIRSMDVNWLRVTSPRYWTTSLSSRSCWVPAESSEYHSLRNCRKRWNERWLGSTQHHPVRYPYQSINLSIEHYKQFGDDEEVGGDPRKFLRVFFALG